MPKITASIVLDSYAENPWRRLTTFLCKYPKFVHAEHCRHRAMSLCVSSSRAIPTARYLEIVRSDEERAEPAFWGAAQKGMSPGGELTDEGTWQGAIHSLSPRAKAKNAWGSAALMAVRYAEYLLTLGVHKSIANRLLDPFVPVNVLVTCCEPGLLNWFGLRLDKSADPTIRALAEAMWAAWSESRPGKLEPGQWHLPFVGEDDYIDFGNCDIKRVGSDLITFDSIALKISAARCARLSYLSYETNRRSTIEEDLALYEPLITARPIHASPAEHQARPDELVDWNITMDVPSEQDREDRIMKTNISARWDHPELHGNLPGFIQHRKTLPGEAMASLPEGYEYNVRPIS